MLFSPVFIATDPRLFTLLALSFEGSLEGRAFLPAVAAVVPPLPDASPLPHKSFRIHTYKSLSKQRTLTIFRTIDLQKTWGRGWLLLSRFPMRTGLDSDYEVAVQGHVAVGHARRVEGKTGIAVAVEKDEAAGGVRALAKKVNGFARREIGGGEVAGISCRNWIDASRAGAKKIHGRLGHHDFHDGFAVAGAGNAAGFGVGIAAAADERRIADAARQLATSSARGSGGEEVALAIDGDGADRSLLVPAMML